MVKITRTSASYFATGIFAFLLASAPHAFAQPGTNIGDAIDTSAGPITLAIEARNRELALRSVQMRGRESKPDSRASRAMVKRLNEDFKELQTIRLAMVEEIKNGRPFEYKRLSDDAAEIRKLAVRLRDSLALTENADESKTDFERVAFDKISIQNAASKLCLEISGFIENPMFKPNGRYSVRTAAEAARSLDTVIQLAANIRSSANDLKP